MSFFQDILPIFKKRELLFLESYKESEDVYTFLFEKENDLTWKAGQHGLFNITHKSIKKPTRPFTVASAPTENKVGYQLCLRQDRFRNGEFIDRLRMSIIRDEFFSIEIIG